MNYGSLDHYALLGKGAISIFEQLKSLNHDNMSQPYVKRTGKFPDEWAEGLLQTLNKMTNEQKDFYREGQFDPKGQTWQEAWKELKDLGILHKAEEKFVWTDDLIMEFVNYYDEQQGEIGVNIMDKFKQSKRQKKYPEGVLSFKNESGFVSYIDDTDYQTFMQVYLEEFKDQIWEVKGFKERITVGDVVQDNLYPYSLGWRVERFYIGESNNIRAVGVGGQAAIAKTLIKWTGEPKEKKVFPEGILQFREKNDLYIANPFSHTGDDYQAWAEYNLNRGDIIYKAQGWSEPITIGDTVTYWPVCKHKWVVARIIISYDNRLIAQSENEGMTENVNTLIKIREPKPEPEEPPKFTIEEIIDGLKKMLNK